MDLNLVKVFIAVAHTKSISQGAKELGFTQSNVTLRIKQLEKSLGYELFHRTNRGVVLSFEGEKFYPYAIEIAKKVEEATQQMRNINHQELLKIGSTQSNATIRLIPIIEMLKKDFEDMKIEFTVDSSQELVNKLLNYEIDIAFINGNPHNKDIEILNSFKDEIYFIEPKDQTAQNYILSYKENCSYCLYLKEYVQRTKPENYKTIALQNYELMLGCVKAGYGVTLLSKKIVEKFGYLNDVKLTKVDSNLDSHLVCRKDYLPMIEDYLRNIKI